MILDERLSQNQLTNGVDEVSHRHHGQSYPRDLHSGNHLLPLIQLWVIDFSRVDDLLVSLTTGNKDFLTQKSSSCNMHDEWHILQREVVRVGVHNIVVAQKVTIENAHQTFPISKEIVIVPTA